MSTRIRVAVLDTGIAGALPLFRGRVAEFWTVAAPTRRTGRFQVVPAAAGDPLGHGTAVAGRIAGLAPRAEFISVQLFSGVLHTSSEALLAALEWLAARDDIALANLSLATFRPDLAARIAALVDRLYYRRCTCVCAEGFRADVTSYPADLSGVIGVGMADLPDETQILYRPGRPCEFAARGNVTVTWNDGAARQVAGASYACPAVTARVANLLAEDRRLTPFEIKTQLKSAARLPPAAPARCNERRQ